MKHVTVLLTEAVDALCITPHSVVVDATLGSGGHTSVLLDTLDESGILIGIDADVSAVEGAQGLAEQARARAVLVRDNFRELDLILKEYGVPKVDAILADLGWRIEQFEAPVGQQGKGFSFKADEPLLMTYGDPGTYAFTADDIVNEWDEEDIGNVIKGYGEERYARRIARAIVSARGEGRIKTSKELADVISSSVPATYRRGKIHPATRTFQALRIAVNDELGALSEFLEKAVAALRPGGRLVIITFHSIEDRIVKRAFRDMAEHGKGTVITKRPIRPSEEEQRENPRARSAKLRIFQTTEPQA